MRRPVYAALLLILGLLIAATVYLTATESGLRWVLTQVKEGVPGRLSFKKINGRLIGPVQVTGINYRSDDLTVSIDSVNLDWKPSRLFLLRIHISDLDAAGINLELGETGTPSDDSEGPSDFSLPLDIRIENLLVRDLSILQHGSETPVTVRELLLRAELDNSTVEIKAFSITTPDIHLSLNGDIKMKGDYPLNIMTEWDIRPEGYSPIGGWGEVRGTLKNLSLTQSVRSPAGAMIDARIYNVLQEPAWEADISVPGLFLDKVNSSWPESEITVKARSSGSLSNFEINGTLDLTEKQYGTISILFSIENDKDTWLAKEIILSIPDTDAAVSLSGEYTQTDGAASFQAQGRWDELSWPIKGDDPVALSRKGTFDFSGSPDKYTFALTGDISGQQIPVGSVSLRGTESFLQLELYSGSAYLSVSGSYANILDAYWKINAPELDRIIPGGKGSLKGEGKITGKADLPGFTAALKGGGLSFDDYQAGELAVNIDIDTSDHNNSMVDIHIDDLLLGTQEINSFSLKADGRIVSHTISLSASTENQTVLLSAEAGYINGVWKGVLTESKLDLDDFGVWRLKQRDIFSISAQASHTGNLCWINDSASACLQTAWTDKDGLSVNAGASGIPLSLFSTLVPTISFEGILEGAAVMHYDTGTLSGNVSFSVPEGSITYRSEDEESITIPLERAGLDGYLNKEALGMNISLPFKDKGYIKGDIHLPNYSPLEPTEKGQILSGRMQAELQALELIPLFTSDLKDTKGTVSSDLNLSGTLSEPALTGHAALRRGSAFVPGLGITLVDLHVDITSNKAGRLHIDGRASSGKGDARITGDLSVKEFHPVNAALNIKGDNFEVLRVPELRLAATPDINIKLQDRNIDINGSLFIPEAEIEPPDFSGGVQASEDVVIVSESSESETEDIWTVNSSLQLKLGDKVMFKGYGLSCRVAGGIYLTDEQGRPAKARGELQIVDGVYKAYGQDLTIEKGRLIFVGLIDDPGLDIRAVRRIKDVLAGIQVRGTLQSPKMTVFSVPSMDQSDALSYILFGRPMNNISNSEGRELHSVATSAYLSGGGFLAKKIGAAFGLEEVEIEQGATVQSSALVLGKYLSPKLYISYGIGLFEPINTLRMRYNLGRRWLLQTEHGIESGGDILYQLEK